MTSADCAAAIIYSHSSVGMSFAKLRSKTNLSAMKAILQIILVFFFQIASLANVYYIANVSTNGNGSFSNPFNNFGSALNAANPGDTVFVMPATYNLSGSVSTVRDGNSSQEITIKAYDSNNKPILTKLGKILNIDHRYYTFDGLIMDGQFGSDDIIEINGNGDYTHLLNCEIRNGLKDGIDLSSADYVTIENCQIHHMLAGTYTNQQDAHGIAATGEKNLTIRGCHIFYVTGDCFQTDPNRGLPLWDNVLIEDCQLWTGPLPVGAAGWNAGEVPGENAVDTKINPDSVNTSYRPKITLRNVESYGFEPGFINNRAAFNIKEKVECEISNVKVYSCEIAFRLRGPGSRGGAYVTIINAIAFNNDKVFRTEDDLELLHIYNGTFDKDSNNDYFENVSGGYDPNGFELKNSLFTGSKPSDASDPSNLTADNSFFVDLLSHDYHLAANSPAIDFGVDIPEVTEDFEGNPRVSGSYDVGAFEYMGPAGIEFLTSVAEGFKLYDNFPNPFNPATNISFSIGDPSQVTLQIYNALGEKVLTMVDGNLAPGKYNYSWDGSNKHGKIVSSGMYYYRITAGNFIKTKKMLFIK
jgi:hypothetical protein